MNSPLEPWKETCNVTWASLHMKDKGKKRRKNHKNPQVSGGGNTSKDKKGTQKGTPAQTPKEQDQVRRGPSGGENDRGKIGKRYFRVFIEKKCRDLLPNIDRILHHMVFREGTDLHSA